MSSTFSFKLSFYARDFVNQKSGLKFGDLAIATESVDDVVNSIWDTAKLKISREVIIEDETISWSTKEFPDKDEIDKFIAIQDTSSRKLLKPSSFTDKICRNLRDKDLNVLVHRYSSSIGSLKVWDRVKKTLIEPENRDRAGAHSTQALRELVDKLKKKHGYNLTAPDISWMAWANSIQSASPNLQEDLINELPPSHIIHLFRSVPVSEAAQLNNLQQHLRVASNVSDAYQEDLQNVRTWATECQQEINGAFAKFFRRLDGIENRAAYGSNLLQAMNSATLPSETTESRQFADLVSNQDDVDHCEF